MLAQERQLQILTLLEANGTVRTTDLAEEFQVTDETIRRDLQVLADGGQLTRIHGGASSLNGRPSLHSFTERSGINVEKKRQIARASLEWIQPGRTYAFDSSTTANEMVRLLPDLPFRVITNAYSVIGPLLDREQVEIVSTGGRYHPKTQTFVGGESYHSIRRHNIDRAFVSCIGLDLDRGAAEGFQEQALFKEMLVEAAEETVLLVDSSKLGQRSEYFFASLENISQIITDGGIRPEQLDSLQRAGCSVVTAA